MVTDGQVRKLRRLLSLDENLASAAGKTGMDEKTARKYRDGEGLPSQRKSRRSWRTRVDPFAAVWAEVQARLEAEPRLRAFTLFGWLEDRYPGRFAESQRRTFERRVRQWRARHGRGREVMFPQVHDPGGLGASDFTSMNSLRVTIAGQPFDHMLYHFTLTYSNWESATVCFSESFEALSRGLQEAFWRLGGVPGKHRSDSLSAAVSLAERAIAEPLSHTKYLAELTDLECQARRESRIARLMHQSRLPSSKTWHNFKWTRLPLQVARQMESLRDGSFLDRRENLLLFGKPGSGKSHCLCVS